MAENNDNQQSKCFHCHLIFRAGQEICPRCHRQTEVLRVINLPRVGDPEYFYFNPGGLDCESYSCPYAEADLRRDMVDEPFLDSNGKEIVPTKCYQTGDPIS